MVHDIKLEPFQLPALESISRIIADRYTGTEITDLFRKAGFTGIGHDGGTKWRFLYSTLEQLQKGDHGPFQILKIIEKVCDPQEYFGNPEAHESIVNNLNGILSFYGLRFDKDKNKVVTTGRKETRLHNQETEDAKLFHLRGFHSEVIEHAKEQFYAGHYFDAVDECCKAFAKYVSSKSKLDKHGSELMSTALSPRGPLKLNAQQTETERSEQEGLMHLCMGLMKGIRNPEEHEPQKDWKLNKEDALDILSFISYLYRKIDKTAYYPY